MAGEAMLLIFGLDLDALRTMDKLLATRSIGEGAGSFPPKEWSFIGLVFITFFRRLFHFSLKSFFCLLPDTEVRLMSFDSSRLIDFLMPINDPIPVPVFLISSLKTAGLRPRLQERLPAGLRGVPFLESPADHRPLEYPRRNL